MIYLMLIMILLIAFYHKVYSPHGSALIVLIVLIVFIVMPIYDNLDTFNSSEFFSPKNNAMNCMRVHKRN